MKIFRVSDENTETGKKYTGKFSEKVTKMSFVEQKNNNTGRNKSWT